MKVKIERPSDEVVVAQLAELNGEATAQQLLDALLAADENLSARQTQLAIQRVYDRGLITLGKDWKLRVVSQEAVAA